MATQLAIALITLSVARGDETTDKLVASTNAGFGEGQEGLENIAVAGAQQEAYCSYRPQNAYGYERGGKDTAVALGGSNLALLVPDRCLDAWLDRLASAIQCLMRALPRGG